MALIDDHTIQLEKRFNEKKVSINKFRDFKLNNEVLFKFRQ